MTCVYIKLEVTDTGSMIAGIIKVCIMSVYEHLYLVKREKKFVGANKNLLGVGVY